MIANRNFERCDPITWVGRMPIYLATALAIAHAITMVITAIAFAANRDGFLATFAFWPQAALAHGAIWQFVTYAFVDPPSLWTAIQIILLAMFGRELETFLGRKSFGILYGLLVIAIPVLLLVARAVGYSMPFSGSAEIGFAVFVGFAFLYPRADVFFSIQARWMAIGLLAIYTLQLLSTQAWLNLAILWLECAVAAAWLMREGVASLQFPALAALRRPKRKPALRVLPKPRREPEPEVTVPDSVDSILEKIARDGIASLSRAERDQLERARTALMEKERLGR